MKTAYLIASTLLAIFLLFIFACMRVSSREAEREEKEMRREAEREAKRRNEDRHGL